MRFCEHCGNKVKRIRTSNENLNFCSRLCCHNFYLEIGQRIKRKEKELTKLKNKLKTIKLEKPLAKRTIGEKENETLQI